MTTVACHPEIQPTLPRRPRARLASPPAIVLDGGANALSIARSLGRRGVKVYAINERRAYVCSSRYAKRVTAAGSDAEPWAQWLTGAESASLHGSVLLAASDAALTLIAEHREALAENFLLDISNPAAQMAMLNKLSTYRAAAAAGVPTPKFWIAKTLDDLAAIRDQLVFPLIVKPQLSHVFEARFGRKFVVAHDQAELTDAFQAASDAEIQTLLVEQIEGPDSLLCSYYTYLDESSEPLVHFTKRILRRWPVGMGGACYHIVDDVPRVRQLGLQLFQHVGLRGLANVEFKLDRRDGELKLIECNARYTAANGLVADCGLDLAWFIYQRLIGRNPPPPSPSRTGVRLWYPLDDFRAFRELRRAGELSFFGWLRSLCHRQTFPYFRVSDPWPSLAAESLRLSRLLGRIRRRFAGR